MIKALLALIFGSTLIAVAGKLFGFFPELSWFMALTIWFWLGLTTAGVTLFILAGTVGIAYCSTYAYLWWKARDTRKKTMSGRKKYSGRDAKRQGNHSTVSTPGKRPSSNVVDIKSSNHNNG